tara:strand:- start:833 stop:1261 length:429 start_codon:yes stop_codon:yes gene_type:complete
MTVAAPISEKVNLLLSALDEDFKQSSRQHHLRNLSDYSIERLKAIDEGTANLNRFVTSEGRKYIKIIMQEYHEYNEYHTPKEKVGYRDGSVHAFVDKKTGELYKADGWQKPAKYVRYNLMDENSLNECLGRLDWAGGYLYMR